jgi:hypothetical protein
LSIASRGDGRTTKEQTVKKQIYIVRWVSAVTGNVRDSACPNKRMADKEAKALTKEGAKQVEVYAYTPAKIY